MKQGRYDLFFVFPTRLHDLVGCYSVYFVVVSLSLFLFLLLLRPLASHGRFDIVYRLIQALLLLCFSFCIFVCLLSYRIRFPVVYNLPIALPLLLPYLLSCRGCCHSLLSLPQPLSPHAHQRYDLDWVVSGWDSNSCDLWEEVQSTSFFWGAYTMRRAMIEGAKFALQMNDSTSAASYSRTAASINATLAAHITSGYVIEAQNRPKDGATLCAFNNGYLGDGVFAPSRYERTSCDKLRSDDSQTG